MITQPMAKQFVVKSGSVCTDKTSRKRSLQIYITRLSLVLSELFCFVVIAKDRSLTSRDIFYTSGLSCVIRLSVVVPAAGAIYMNGSAI